MGFDYVKKVRICEVGLRDGLQNEKTILTTDQKVELLRDMIDAGLKVIEVGSFVHRSSKFSRKRFPRTSSSARSFPTFAALTVLSPADAPK